MAIQNVLNKQLHCFAVCTWLAAFAFVGCGIKRRRFDKPPSRGFLQDRWPGHYFNRVSASYSIPLQNTSRELWRDFQSSVPVISTSGTAPTSLSGFKKTAPTRATVELEYWVDDRTGENGTGESKAIGSGKAIVTLHWPIPNAGIDGPRTANESKTVVLDQKVMRDFLEESGAFQVERGQHYYRARTQELRSYEDRVPVKIRVEGPSPDSRVDTTAKYDNPFELYQLVDRAWPGAG